MSRIRGFALLAVFAAVNLSLAHSAENPLSREQRRELGKKYLAEGKPKEAKDLFEELSKSYPKEAELHLFLALASLRLRDPTAAEIAVRRALSLEPNHVEAGTLLGWIAMEVRRDYPAAVQAYARVVELKPDRPEALNNLGVALKKNGELDKAIANFNRAVALKGDYSEALSNRGWAYVEQRKWREARADFEQALKVNPDDEGALYGLSQALREVRDYAGAGQALRRLIARAPNFVYWLEWGRVELVRYYWVFLLVAVLVYLQGRYRRTRRRSDGGGDGQKT